MSIFSELLPHLYKISNLCSNNFNRDLKNALEKFDTFEREFKSHNVSTTSQERAQNRDKNAMITLQSIDEGEDETNKKSDSTPSNQHSETDSRSSNEGKRRPKKRSKPEVDDMSSPEQDRRAKRNASVKAQSIISKQVNVNLNQKLRRENPVDKAAPERQLSQSRRHKDDEKENLAPQEPLIVHIKQEKLSILSDPEPMETEVMNSPPKIVTKQEKNKDDIAMPPPVAPVPKPRKAALKEKAQEKPHEETSEEEPRRSRRGTRSRKQTDVATAAVKEKAQENLYEEASEEPRRSRRGTRSRKQTDGAAGGDASRSSSRAREPEQVAPPAPDARPKRTRGRKKLSEIKADSGGTTQSSTESLPASPAEKPRPKRTRRAQKADKEEPKPADPEPIVSPKEERPSEEPPQRSSSTILQVKSENKKDKATEDSGKIKQLTKSNSSDNDLTNTNDVEKDLANTNNVGKDLNTKNIHKDFTNTQILKDLANTKKTVNTNTKSKSDKLLTKTEITDESKSKMNQELSKSDKDLVKTKINGLNAKTVMNMVTSVEEVDNICLDEIKVLSKVELDQTVVLPNGVFNHAPVTPKNILANDEKMALEKTMILDKRNGIMDATVVLERVSIPPNVTEDDSLITDDSDSQEEAPSTPPGKGIPDTQPLSAVKEKVQQFEEMASRVTRTKTRAMAKKEEAKDTENQTPPSDKICKVVISTDTLNKMNSLIFNTKQPQVSNSACKPRAAVPVRQTSASASKAAAINRAREAAEETLRREDARQKKEALLEAKREQQKRKREEKMAAAAAVRSAAERERRAMLEAAARERFERQQHAESERSKQREEAERKKQELARKVAETEERRRAEETARHQRLAEEQRRAMEQRNKKNEEAEAVRKEEARMAKEIEKKQREYNEKMKKQKMDKMNTPFKTPLTPLGKYHAPLAPVYMQDGFQYLNSDEEAETPDRPVPAWSTTKARRHILSVQKRIRKQTVDQWFGIRVHSPDLTEIFPHIERARLKRTSSAVWHTPPSLPPRRD